MQKFNTGHAPLLEPPQRPTSTTTTTTTTTTTSVVTRSTVKTIWLAATGCPTILYGNFAARAKIRPKINTVICPSNGPREMGRFRLLRRLAVGWWRCAAAAAAAAAPRKRVVSAR